MDLDQARAFIREHHRAVLVTHKKDGTPQTSPVSVGVAADGRLAVSSRETAFKVKNLRRDPRATLCVFTDAFYGKWIQASDVAEVVSLPDAMELLVEYYRGVAGEHDDWDAYRQAMEDERRVMVLVSLEAAGPDAAG